MKELKRPLKEHFETETDVGAALATFDYIEKLDKYCDRIEKERDELKERLRPENDEAGHELIAVKQELQTLKEEIRKYIYVKEDNYPKLKELIK